MVKKNRAAKKYKDTHEFISAFQKEDHLHPMFSICIHYGEDPWDGPTSLSDMLMISPSLSPLFQDYKMTLVQVRNNGEYTFSNPDVQNLFEICSRIYKKDYGKIEEVYRDKDIPVELGIAIGAVTGSNRLINVALEEGKGVMNMCTALEELRNEGKLEVVVGYRHTGRT